MVLLAAVSFAISVTIFGALLFLVSVEVGRGRRLFMAKWRDRLDRVVDVVNKSVGRRWRHFVRYIVQLGWYYSLHSILQGALRLVVVVYNYFEHLFEHNRKRTKRLRAEKRTLSKRGHLGKVAAHKAEVALTMDEQQRLMEKKLEGKD